MTSLINETDLLGFTNWSGLSQSNDILNGINLSVQKCNRKRILFFDLADPSCKSSGQFTDLFSLIEKLSISFHIILSFNCNEILIAYNQFFNCNRSTFNYNMAKELVTALPADEVVVHSTDWAIAAGKDYSIAEVKVEKVTNPVILTGAGDNFNAGYCLGKLCSFDSNFCLHLGNISATLYVERGHPVGINEIVTYIEQLQ